MTNERDRRWPYLSPARAGWEWVRGTRGEVRRLLRTDEPVNATRFEPVDTVLENLERLDRLLQLLQQDVLALVTEAYYRGASWSDIARRLDRSKQTVHQRYQARVHARRTHETLRNDLTEAYRRARELQLWGGDERELTELVRFAREQAALRGRRPDRRR